MSENVNKPEIGFRTQDDINLKVADDASPESSDAQVVPENSASGLKSVTAAPVAETARPESHSHTEALAPSHDEPVLKIHSSSAWGLRRHRLIIAGCMALSVSCIGLSTLDLRHLIHTPAFISDNLKVSRVKDRPELPNGYIYNFQNNEGIPESEGGGGLSSDKLVPIIKTNWEGYKFGFADHRGKVVVPAVYASVRKFQEGLCAVTKGSSAATSPDNPDPQKWGFIDEKGLERIPLTYESVDNFHNGAAAVSENGQWGLIDKNGKTILKPQYRQISELGANFRVLDERERVGIVSPQGEWLLPPLYSQIERLGRPIFQFGWPIISSNAYYSDSGMQNSYWIIREWGRDSYGVVDSNGKILIPMKYDAISSYNDGVAAVKVDGKIGFVNGKGEWVIKPQFEAATSYADIIGVQTKVGSDDWSFIDRTGKAISALTSAHLVSDPDGKWLKHDRAVFSQEGKFGYLDSKGNIAIKPQFVFALPFEGKYAPVWNGSSWRFVDKNGNFAPGIFQYLSLFSHGFWSASIQGPFFSLIEGPRIKDINQSIKGMTGHHHTLRINRGRRW